MPIRGAFRLATGAGAFAPTPPSDLPPAILSFTVDDPTLLVGQTGTFAFSFGGGALTSWSLDINDAPPAEYTGNADGSQPHVYTSAGTFTARLTATGPGGSVQATITGITVTAAAPTITTFAIDDTTLLTTQAATFTFAFGGGTLTGWTLNIDDTGAAEYSGSAGGTQLHTYSGAGAYTARLIATGPGGTAQATITSISVSEPAPDVRVLGNGIVIADGDATPSSTDHTIFPTVLENAGVVTRTFTVENTGSANLTTSGLTVPSGFTITEGLAATIAPGASDTFTVQLDDAVVGVKSGGISFATNVTGKNPYNFAIQGEVSAGSLDFQSFATFKSDQSGEHWLTPLGIPVPHTSVVNRTRRSKIFARKWGTSLLYPVQTEQFKHRTLGDDGLQHCTGHIKVPASYVAGDKWEVGYSDTEPVPSTPDWATIFSSNPAISVALNCYQQRVHYLKFNNIHGGDIATITFSDGLGSDQVISHEFDLSFGNWKAEAPGISLNRRLAEKITLTTGGRYTSQAKFAGTPTPVNRPHYGGYSRGWDENYAQFGNGSVGHHIGYRQQDGTFPADFQPVANDSGTQVWPQAGFFIWPRGDLKPGDYTLTVAITRAGVRLPVAGGGTLNLGYKKLAYKSKTQNFTSNGYIVGATSGTQAYVLADGVVGGTTGTLYIGTPQGPGFIDDEVLNVYDSTQVLLTGSARVNGTGAVTYQTITSSSGGTAKFLSLYGNDVYVKDVVGSFNSGDTITGDLGSTTMNGASVASSATFNNTYNTTAQSGVLTPVNDSVAPVVYTATLALATATPNSPWFDGHQVRQIEKKMAVKTAGGTGTAHPELEVYFRLTKDRDGNVVDWRIAVENNHRKNGIDWWYDATVVVDGVDQTTGNPNYQGMYHELWTSWLIHKSKPNFMCDPADFMHARIISPLRRYPTWDASYEIKAKMLGLQTGALNNFTLPASTPGLAPAVQTEFNVPLWPGPWEWNASPGGRMELGDYNTVEAIFWQSNSLLAMPALLALVENDMHAQGFIVRMEGATGEEEEDVPNFYTKWDYNTAYGGAADARTGKRHGKATGWPGTYRQRYTLAFAFNPRQSHGCSSGHFSAYVARPEKEYWDGCKQMAYAMVCNTEGVRLDRPKTGGAAGDVNHRIGYTTANGERAFARPARDACSAAFCMFEGARNRTMWRRLAGDYAYWSNDLVSKTIWGIWTTRHGGATSDGPTIEAMAPGELVNGTSGSWSSQGVTFDYFKGLFCSVTMTRFQNMHVADVMPTLTTGDWFVRSIQKAAFGNWWNGVSNGYGLPVSTIFVNPADMTWTGSNFVVTVDLGSPYHFRCTADWTMEEQRLWREGLTDSAQKNWASIFTSPDNWANINGSLGGPKRGLRIAGYATPKYHYAALLFYSIYGPDETLRTSAINSMALIDAYAPADELINDAQYGIRPDNGQFYTNAQIQQQTAYYTYDQILRW